jgi:hypothetical protein
MIETGLQLFYHFAFSSKIDNLALARETKYHFKWHANWQKIPQKCVTNGKENSWHANLRYIWQPTL